MKNQAEIVNSPTPYFNIDKFPKEFKKNWILAIDYRYFSILVTTFIVTIASFSYLLPYELNRPVDGNPPALHENFARLLGQEQWFEDKSADSVTGTGTSTDIRRTTPTAAVTATGQSSGSALVSATESGDNANSTGILKFITTDARNAEHTSSDIQDYEGATSFSSLANFDGAQLVRQRGAGQGVLVEGASGEYEIKGSKLQNVEIGDVMSSLSGNENTSNKVIVKNVDWEEIPSSELRRNQNRRHEGLIRSPEDITRIMVVHNRTIQECYKLTLKRNANIKGKVVVRFSVTPDGDVNDVNIISSNIKDEEMENCILRRIKMWNDFGICDPSMGDLSYRQTYVFGY